MRFSFKKTRKNLHVHSDKNLVVKNPDPILSEALKAARINIMYTLSDEQEGAKTLLVTSAFSGEGKTTTSINLATTLAQTQSKILIIDADLRKPRVHEYLGVKNADGLSNHLGGFCDLDAAIKHSDEFNIDFVVAGDIPPNPAELLASNKFKDFVSQVKERYDYIIFDTPPVNAVADALAIVPTVKNVVFICRCGISITKEVQKAVSALEFTDAKILGFITIDAHERKADYYQMYSSYYNYK